MWRLPGELETLEAFELLEQAREERRVVRLSYFRVMKDKRGRPLQFNDSPPVMDAFGPRPMLAAAPVARTCEPVLTAWSKEGRPYATVIMYDCSSGMDQRTVRIDRIAVGSTGMHLHVTRRPFTVAGTGLDPTVDRRAQM